MNWMPGKRSRRLSSGWVRVPTVQTPVLPTESPNLCRIKMRLPHENRCCDITQYYLLPTNVYTPTGTIACWPSFFFSCFTSNGRILILPLGFFIVLVNIYVFIHVLMCVIRHPDIISTPIQCLLSLFKHASDFSIMWYKGHLLGWAEDTKLSVLMIKYSEKPPYD